MIVIAGAAGVGKTTVCCALADEPGVVALDGDVIGAGAAAVAQEPPDYPAFWAYVRTLARTVHANGLVPVIGCVCLPDQVLPRPDEPFLRVAVLALVADATTLLARRAGRPGGDDVDARRHLAVDTAWRRGSLAPPHRLEVLDTSDTTVEATVVAARRWVRHVVDGARDPDRPSG